MSVRRLGDYTLVRVIGQGGQGVVYLGESPAGTKVAVKVLHARFAGDDDARRRFLREVAVTRQVAPFCTARVIDVDMTEDQPYIVSEYVDGPSLDDLVRREGARDEGGLARLAISTMTALMAIHRAGIVHRDLKPGNVLLGPEGPVVIDFGIAKVLDAAATRSSVVMGTPSFMSPEQVAGAPIGPASDIFSWAATIAYAATGRPPFGGDSIPAVFNRISHGEPDLAGVAEPLKSLLNACLLKRPEDRPSAPEILGALAGGTNVEPVTGGRPPAVDPRNRATLAYTKRLEQHAPPSPPFGAGRERTAPPAPPVTTPRPPSRPAGKPAANRGWGLAATIALVVWGAATVLRLVPDTSPAVEPSATPPVATVTVSAPAVARTIIVPSPVPMEDRKSPEVVTSSPPPAEARTSIGRAAIVGTWKGVYHCLQGATGLTLTIGERPAADGIKATFEFYALPDNPSVPSGAYVMHGTFADGTLTLRGDHWIDRPDNYVMIDLVAEIRNSRPDGIEGTALAPNGGGWCSTFEVERQS